MTLKWYHLTLFSIMGILLVLFFGWTPTSKEDAPLFKATPVPEPQAQKVLAPTAPQVTQGGDLSKMAPEFQGLDIPTVKESLEMHPDIHPSITMFHAMFPDKSVFDTPELKKFLEVFSSPAYNELISNGPLTREEYDAFWTENGFYRDPNRFMKKFREHFPTGEPEDYEPEMRAYLLELAKGIPDEELAAHKPRLREAFRDPRILAWKAGQFQGRGGAFKNPGWGEWFNSTLAARDRTPIPAAVGEVPVEVTTKVQGQTPSIESPLPSEATETFEIPRFTETRASTDDTPNRTAPEPDPSLNLREALEGLKLPELPTDARLESQLRARLHPEQFSPQRMTTAIQTITQYGPEEGLRRLKDSDPEIAPHVQRLIRPEKETD